MDGMTTREVEVEMPIEGTFGETRTETRNVPAEVTYDDIVLQFTDIDAQGNFTGNAAVNGEVIALYDGMIAGPDAGASAGVVVIDEASDVLSDAEALERGAFIARAVD